MNLNPSQKLRKKALEVYALLTTARCTWLCCNSTGRTVMYWLRLHLNIYNAHILHGSLGKGKCR